MIASAPPAGCPSVPPLVTNSPYPWQCIPGWEKSGALVPYVPPGAPSWWTLWHVVGAILLAAGLFCLVKLVNSFTGRGPGWLR